MFDLTGGGYQVVKRQVSDIERKPHLVYQDFELVGTDMRNAINQLNTSEMWD